MPADMEESRLCGKERRAFGSNRSGRGQRSICRLQTLEPPPERLVVMLAFAVFGYLGGGSQAGGFL